jgi:hypothetical protein
MMLTGSGTMDAELAFAHQSRARRRAALARRLRGKSGDAARLPVVDARALLRGRGTTRGVVREIPIGAIRATLEPSRAAMFDGAFRPRPAARARWQRVWLAEHRGAVLPPVSVVPIGDAFALRDGHHRVSVAKARGALTIDASIDAA